MRLAAKLILVFLVGVLMIVSLFSWQTIQSQRRWEDRKRQEHATDLVDSLMPAILQAYREGGTVQIRHVVETTAQRFSGRQLRWVDPESVQSGDEPIADSREPTTGTRVTERTTSTVLIADKNGSTTAYTYVPVEIDGQAAGSVEVSNPMSDYEQNTRRSLVASLVSLFCVTVLCVAVIFWGGFRMVARPLQRLIRQVNQIGEGNFDQQISLSSSDELGDLAVAVNDMTMRLRQQRDTIESETEARIRTQRQLRHADRLGTIGTLAAGVAHELGTPLNVVAGRAGLIASGRLSSDDVTKSAITIQSEAERMTAIIRQLLDFSRQKTSAPSQIELCEVLRRTCDLMRPLATKSTVDLKLSVPAEPVMILADAAQVQQVVTNLLGNAVQAMPDGGTIDISLQQSDRQPPPDIESDADAFVCIGVHDSGRGMSDDELQHAFEPFFTTKDIGQGTGLGLSIAYGIIREHGGWIEAESGPKNGTTFRVYLPKLASPSTLSDESTTT